MSQSSTLPLAAEARDARIRAAQHKVIERMTADLAAARSTIVTTGSIDEGLACKVEQGPFSAVLDLGHGMGGDASGPSPGFFARAAIVGCVAIAVKMLATRKGVRFDAVDVAVETDFNDAALFGLGAGNAAPLQTRVKISVTTTAPTARVAEIVCEALEMDPWFLALRDPQTVVTEVAVQETA